MVDVNIKDSILSEAAKKDMDSFLKAIVDAIYSAIGGELNSENMQQLNSFQITLLAYCILRDEVMDGGFIQLIHNGYGGFIFMNPFSKAMREWGLIDLAKLINKTHKVYSKFHSEIEVDCTDDEFMEMFEKMPEFDDYDDNFVENEESWTGMVALFVDKNIKEFVNIEV
jgi:hypothetical protein